MERSSNSETIIHAAPVVTKATLGYGSEQTMEEEVSLEAQNSDGEEKEPDIESKIAYNSETIIHAEPVA